MKICLYIPCRNGSAFLPTAVAAVAAQTATPFMRLLVDDQSTDGSAEIARQAGWTVIATNRDRNGLSAGRNLAIAAAADAGCDILAGLDVDAVPCAEYVAIMAQFFADNPGVSAVCGNMRERFTDTPSDLWRAVHMRQHWGDQPLENPPILYGSSAAHRVAVLQAAGGFNESLRTNFEDTELTQRLRAANHRLAYVPSLRLDHLKRDDHDSVLRMFWNWYLPPSVLAGHFSSVDTWLKTRLPWIWSDYRSRSRLDDPFPTLSLLTLALPWVQVIRDLYLLSEQLAAPIDASPVADLASRMLVERGHDESIAEWIAARVRRVPGERASSAAGSLNTVILNAIASEASTSLPRRSFWDAVNQSARALAVSDHSP